MIWNLELRLLIASLSIRRYRLADKRRLYTVHVYVVLHKLCAHSAAGEGGDKQGQPEMRPYAPRSLDHLDQVPPVLPCQKPGLSRRQVAAPKIAITLILPVCLRYFLGLISPPSSPFPRRVSLHVDVVQIRRASCAFVVRYLTPNLPYTTASLFQRALVTYDYEKYT
jgi:hypothetical protein